MNITLNGWTVQSRLKVRPGLWTSRWAHNDGRTAREIVRGRDNVRVGIAIYNRDGNFIQMVPDVVAMTHA